MSEIVVGIIVGSIVAIVAFILGLFGNMWYGHYQESRQRQNEALKKHFDDLDKVMHPLGEKLCGTFNELGKIMTIVKNEQGEPLHTTPILYAGWPYFKEGDYSEISSHFTKEAEDCDQFVESAIEHNENLKRYEEELFTQLDESFHFETRTLRYDKKRLSQTLRMELCEIAKERREIKATDKDSPLLNLPTDWGEINRITKTPEGKFQVHTTRRFCIEAADEQTALDFIENLHKMQNSEILIQKTDKLFEGANKLETKAQNIGNRFRTIRKQYLEFGKILKRKKDCPTCKLIFE